MKNINTKIFFFFWKFYPKWRPNDPWHYNVSFLRILNKKIHHVTFYLRQKTFTKTKNLLFSLCLFAFFTKKPLKSRKFTNIFSSSCILYYQYTTGKIYQQKKFLCEHKKILQNFKSDFSKNLILDKFAQTKKVANDCGIIIYLHLQNFRRNFFHW